MTIEKVKKTIQENEGKTLSFKFNGARNQIEEFEGEIVETYPKIFVIQLHEENAPRKSFTYSDILTESLEIITK